MEKITGSDFASPETMHDFMAFYKRLAGQQEPLYRLDDFFGMGGAWLAFRHEDVVAILKDPRFVKDVRKLAPPQDQGEPGQKYASVSKFRQWFKEMPNMLTVDPPDHTRLRRLASKAFTPHTIEGLRPRIQQIADELLDAVQERGRMDLITDFAYPLPITVISEMLGIPVADRDQFREWTRKLLNASLDPKQEDTVSEVLDKFVEYIKTLLAEKRAHPGNDITSGLVQAHDEGDQLSENELLSTIWLLIVAGHETTVNLIGNGILALLKHPEQMRLLRSDPSLLPSAVEELLRYAGPVMIASRFASEDIPMHGNEIRKGEIVLVSLAGANVDPHKFSHPEVLDITREENEHLAFGKGIHLCLGAPLARLEGQVAFGTLLQRLPHLRLAVEPEQLTYNRSTLRSLTSLPVLF
ncbi:cytochrome P450 family protein [Paenibacillus tyrfis]|uniref:Cytochrome P450 n=1 Tax=Paenibacillus tyrfis TaxID=1501230 RepID=A0A081P2B1_9BACL|nr:cytochrome P450 [Paenibacillus tyrfis]KEQ24834.1 cytochrome P450 [Paenibacillus tyrfis]